MKASFVIVNYNRKNEIIQTINATKKIIANNAGYEIIVVDNASTDGSAEAIATQHPDVRLINSPVNLGAPAWNIGFEQAKGKYFILLDDDSEVTSGLENAITYLDSSPKVGVLALNITGGAFETNKWIDRKQYSGFIGCGAIIRKEVYDIIGGYAPWIFLYTNEYEFGLRCMDAGYEIRYFADCKVLHRTSVINRTSERLITYSVRNEMAIIYKYFNKSSRSLFLTRVFLNNLRCVSQYGLKSVPWYFNALRQFRSVKKELQHTPVNIEVEHFYSRDFWSARPFLGIF